MDKDKDVDEDEDEDEFEDEPGGSGLAPVPLHPCQLGTRGILLHLEQGGISMRFST